ncbi:DMT family transporter [Symbiobacterium thermophilum]|uniref:Putative transporter protein n=1 Tax=Symbiobacterium thermophilum (strain DSM 24528 / JCM 14929 / IAM 14863 / T) TaxID=292459 RepID=Q67NK7_SYMTH|nr:EamA family transporter [Symbiobacterium thermophilum]BAD40736.1 putative transporter protein [Symbiobacterium thermophilum IAM 14863]
MERTRGRQTLGYMMVFGAASLWGTLGVVSRNLYVGGLSAQAVVTLRASMAAALLLAALTVLRPATLRVRLRDIPLFAAYGLVSVAAFYLLYFLTIQHLSVAAAAVLMYTAPAFVAVAAALTLGEPLTQGKLLALTLTMAGCALVARAYEPSVFRGQLIGVLTGLGSGFTYGMYSIFGKHALKRYNPWTVQAYSLLFGAAPLVLFFGREAVRSLARSPEALPWLAYLALVTTLGAYGLYLSGLQVVEASHAALLSTVEPVVAALLGFWILEESLRLPQVIGILLVLGSAVILNAQRGEPAGAASRQAGVPPAGVGTECARRTPGGAP